jgi:hypothetical protein
VVVLGWVAGAFSLFAPRFSCLFQLFGLGLAAFSCPDRFCVVVLSGVTALVVFRFFPLFVGWVVILLAVPVLALVVVVGLVLALVVDILFPMRTWQDVNVPANFWHAYGFVNDRTSRLRNNSVPFIRPSIRVRMMP